MIRPPIPFGAPKGFRWMVRPAEDWTTARLLVSDLRCRFLVRGRAHGVPAVAALRRKHGRGWRWWGYCGDPAHLFGRWIDAAGPFEGTIVEYVLRPEVAP